MQSTKYPGVKYRVKVNKSTGKDESIFYVRYYTPEGKERFEKVGSSIAQQMTAAKANQIRIRRVEGKELPNSVKREQKTWTIDKLWDTYLELKSDIKSIDRDKYTYSGRIQPIFGNKEPSEIQALDVDRYKVKLLQTEGLSPQRVRNILELLRRLSNFGVKKQICPGLQFQIEMPKIDNVIDESLRPKQVRELLSTLKSNRCPESYIMELMLFTGRRTGEIKKLQWQNIDLERKVMELPDTKTGKTQRVPISNYVAKLFTEIPKTHEQYLFININGKSLKELNDKRIRDLARKSGIPDSYRPTYCLRHTFASIAASNGILEKATQFLIGHKVAANNMIGRYAHISDKVLRESANKMAEFILNN